MAQKTTLSPAGLPGRTYSFNAKDEAVIPEITISAERTYAILADDRNYVVVANDRNYEVSADDRAYIVPVT